MNWYIPWIIEFICRCKAAFNFKEVCKTERLKSDLVDADDKPACQDVAKLDLKMTYILHLTEYTYSRE